MVGEGEQHVALDRAVAAAGVVRGHDQAADRAARLVHRAPPCRLECRARANMLRGARVALVVLGDDQAALRHRAPGDALAAARSRTPRSSSASRPRMATSSSTSGSSGGTSSSAATSSAEQLPGAQADRVEHVLAHGAVGDRALDAGEPLEQLLAFLERVEQPLVQLRLHLGLAALAALLGGEPEQPQRQAQHVRHAAREVHLLAREVVCLAREDEPRRRVRLDRDRERRPIVHTAAPSAGRCGPSAMSASAASTTGSRLKPTEATTLAGLRSSTARSAPSASAARSTATRLAVRSSSADETIARKPVSCWTDQLPDAPDAGGAGTSDEACCECTPIGAGAPHGIRARC